MNRVVITGLGPVTPVGIGRETYWNSLIQGKASFRNVEFENRDMSQYRSRVAAPIGGFDLSYYVGKSKHSKHLGRTSQFAIVGTMLALQDAGILLEKKGLTDDPCVDGAECKLQGIDPFRVGVILGIGAEAMDLMEYYHERFLSKGPRGVSPFALPNVYLSSTPSLIAKRFSMGGTSYALCTACASATHAMINSFLQIQRGGEDLIITGGADACITPYVFGAFDVMRAMSTRNDEPEKACRPFDRQRDGFVMGEGAGILVFEELEHARKRGAHVYGEIIGFGMTADA